VQAALGLEPDVPGGRVRLRPLPDMPLEVRGLRIAGRPVDVRVDTTGNARIEGSALEQVVDADGKAGAAQH
jgi:hypothetical protein